VQNVFGSYMAQGAEVAVSKDGEVAVKRVTCALDCGIGINPNSIEAQAQRSDRRPLWRDHAERRPGETEQFR
jgi:CO/xanthine dehydrogenase Mo-binding subunit